MIDFRNLELSDIHNGYISDDKCHTCIFCEQVFNKEEVFSIGDKFYNSSYAIKNHINSIHGGVFEQLINLDKKQTTLTDLQKEYFKLLHSSKNDKEIAEILKTNTSIVRNQRFTFKEKAMQAKTYLTLYNLSVEDSNYEQFVPININAKMIDDRYFCTDLEKNKILKNFLICDNPIKIKSIPAKAKHKLVILNEIQKLFKQNLKYTEVEINDILKPIYSDYASLRRLLIEYSLLQRSTDCLKYWR